MTKDEFTKEFSPILIERIATLSAIKGDSVASACRQSGAGEDLSYNVKVKKSVPGIEKICSLADYFGVSTDYLLGRTDSMAAPARSVEDPTLTTLLGYYDRFNQEGREKLVAYAADLQEKYTKAPAPISLKAAARDGGVKSVPAEAADSATKKMVTSGDETL